MRDAALVLLLAGLLARTAGAGEDAPAEGRPVERPKEEVSAEHVVRQRFLVAYQTAQTPERQAEAVEMLRGLKEKDSLRLIAGMLGNAHETVRCRACLVMAATPDPEGYLVKPLMGTLTDAAPAVRCAAAEALGNAAVRGEAIKALAFALMEIAGGGVAVAGAEARLVEAYNRALQQLTRQTCTAKGARDTSSFWMDYWKQHGEELVAKEKQAREVEPAPRPANLPKDSFDK